MIWIDEGEILVKQERHLRSKEVTACLHSHQELSFHLEILYGLVVAGHQMCDCETSNNPGKWYL